MIAQHRQHVQRLARSAPPDRTACRPRRRTAPRTRPAAAAFSAARWLSSRFAEHHAGEERAERERHAEQLRRAERDAERRARARPSVNSSREPVRATCAQQPRKHARPDRPASARRSADLAQGEHSVDPAARRPPPAGGAARRPAVRRTAAAAPATSTITRSSTISQPTAMWPLIDSSSAALLERPQQHHRAGDRERTDRTPASPERPAPQRSPTATPSAVAMAICATAPGNAMRRTANRSCEREVQADAEHQQHDADLRELPARLDVGDEARRGGTDDDARDQIADEGRQTQPDGEEATDEGEGEADGESVAIERGFVSARERLPPPSMHQRERSDVRYACRRTTGRRARAPRGK